MTQFTLRKALETDLSFLWEMLYHSIYIPEGEEQPPMDLLLQQPPIAKYLKDWGKADDHAIIATDIIGESVGAIWIRKFERDNAGWGFVDEDTPELGMAILPAYRGKGIGRKLLHEMLRRAHSLGYRALSLSVDPRNLVALRLYETTGFIMAAEDAGGSRTMKKTLFNAFN